ncbi:uncharacterized protein BO80DRAFT_191111 [Aspergillus ibericus CBS 121593]|uniref:Uncharacterized protein n=1 Tax=Aspergillus ibericus CBS 121593 TaxID=1448316 RepID=A0A395GPY1_9EURO|nr:hypothetical protein BO80DRAFT_191111 [Aspergillus ibericus CBS 121593]RAK97529.1 hypothetical protein BO80DRAFT_191111 [Aspergillus ibericus CBS 121593]
MIQDKTRMTSCHTTGNAPSRHRRLHPLSGFIAILCLFPTPLPFVRPFLTVWTEVPEDYSDHNQGRMDGRRPGKARTWSSRNRSNDLTASLSFLLPPLELCILPLRFSGFSSHNWGLWLTNNISLALYLPSYVVLFPSSNLGLYILRTDVYRK